MVNGNPVEVIPSPNGRMVHTVVAECKLENRILSVGVDFVVIASDGWTRHVAGFVHSGEGHVPDTLRL